MLVEVPKCDHATTCAFFEDNNGAIELAKMRPRTKHSAIKYHNFRSFVERSFVLIKKVDAAE